MDDLQQRRDEFRELFALIPGQMVKDKMQWLVDNIGCSRTTARIWNMRDSNRPPPSAKLMLIRRMLNNG